MSHTYAQNVIHVVFSTKDRRKSISPEFQPRLWAYSAGICQKLGILVHALGGAEDHIHFLIQVPPSVALAKAILTVKSNSSRWSRVRDCCALFSCSVYEAHHKKMGFDAESLALLNKHGMEFDPKFVFD
jgi:putative transposase